MGDPEGLFSTLPAVVSTLLGYFTGQWLRRQKTDSSVSMTLTLCGLVCLTLGKIWSWGFPINKKLWTSSYVLFMGGMALVLFAACYEWIEVRGRRRLAVPFEIMGTNSIAAFTASVLMIKIFVKTSIGGVTSYEWINNRVFVSWLGPWNGPTMFAVATVAFWWLVLYYMHKRRIYIKV
jgi:predicted acyltransferase